MPVPLVDGRDALLHAEPTLRYALVELGLPKEEVGVASIALGDDSIRGEV